MTERKQASRKSADPRVKALGQAMAGFLVAKDALLARAADFGMTSGWGLDAAVTRVWDGIDEALTALSRGEPLPADAVRTDAEEIRTGSPGRPSMRDWYCVEHERRCETGEALYTLNNEADYLAKWLREEHKGQAHYPKADSIANVIRSRHQTYKLTR